MADELVKIYAWVVEHPVEGEMIATRMTPSPMAGGVMLGAPMIAPTEVGALSGMAELQNLSDDHNVTIRLYAFEERREIATVSPHHRQRNGH